MLGIMFQKLRHKKWMVTCLLIGSILLIATVVSFPMYRSAAFDRLLRDEFEQAMIETGEWQSEIAMHITSEKGSDGTVLPRMEAFVGQQYERLGVTEKDTVIYYNTIKAKCHSLMNREDLKDIYLRVAMLSELAAHLEISAGEMYSDSGRDADGCVEAVISQECMVASGLLVGETLEFYRLTDVDGEPLRVKITGVYNRNTDSDFYWQSLPAHLPDVCLIKEDVFRELFVGERGGENVVNGSYYLLFEYDDLKSSGVAKLSAQTDKLLTDDAYRKIQVKLTYPKLLESFEGKKNRIEATLFILQMPVLVLLCAFLFMISAQMYDMERNEISVIKSRGSSGGQIFRLYLYQSTFLTLVGLALGFPLGMVFCRILGSARNFLEFDVRANLDITYDVDVVWYALAAAVVSILIMTLPAIKHSRLSIVHLKQQKVVKKRTWWERCFLDIICLATGVYGYYNYTTNEKVMMESVLGGEALDPLLYFSSSIFIVGAGLLFLRLQPLLVRIIYLLGRKFWGPAGYASFLENMQNGRKQHFIMLFLILTISLGMYHATVARTILQNALDNSDYLDGTDVIIQEVWETNPYYFMSEDEDDVQYYEPDFYKYSMMEDIESYTKVLYDTGFLTKSKHGRVNLKVMGIHTKEFGETTFLKEGLQEKHYYEYLNELAVTPKGVLLSRGFQTVLEYQVGDKINYCDSLGRNYTGVIVDFFDYWPGFAPYTTTMNTDGTTNTKENYLVVAHYSDMLPVWGGLPYEVWVSLKEDAGSDSLYQWIQENDVRLAKYKNRQDDRTAVVEDPLLQGTNGILTMGFIVTMILCAVGYLIYWIMSIRSREMMFGVLRACGMHKWELFHMLINEQIFSGVFSVLAGIGIGKLASKMYVPILQTAYAASNQVLPMELITNRIDMVRLYSVIAGTMAICLIVVIVIVCKLNVVKALKLGEE